MSRPLDQIDQMLDAARRKLLAGDAAGAGQLCADVLRHRPDCQAALVMRTEAALLVNDPHQALRCLDAADLYDQQQDAPVDAAQANHRLLLRCEVLVRLERHEQAIATLERLLQHDPAHREGRLRLAVLLIDRTDHRAALPHLQALREQIPDDPQLHWLIGQTYEATGRNEAALAAYEQTSDLLRLTDAACDIDEADLLLRIARLQHKVGRLADAAASYEQLVSLRTDDAVIIHEAIDLAVETGDEARATQYMRLAEAADEDATSRHAVAEQHMRCGRFDRAARCWWRLYRHGQHDAVAMSGLIVCALIHRRFRFAQRLTDELTHLTNPPQRRRLMARMWQLAQPGRLLHDMLDPDTAEHSRSVLSSLLQQAAATLTRQLADHDRRADLHYHLAICHDALEQPDAAADRLDRALHVNGGYLDAARLRIKLLLANRNHSAAEALIEAVQSHRGDPVALLDLKLVVLLIQDRLAEAQQVLAGAQLNRQMRQNVIEQVGDCLLRHDRDQLWQLWQAACRDLPDSGRAQAA